MAFTQENQALEITTNLGKDKVLIRIATVTEQLGRPFEIHVELLAEDANLSFDTVIGHNATIRMELAKEGQTRYFNGFVSRFTYQYTRNGMSRYRATLVPWLWFLTRTSDCRIFQKMKVPDIISKVFRDHGFSDFRLSLSGTYLPWDYCVQYRETDFNFVSRLMEQEGIYYFFEHEDGKHTLVLGDAASSHKAFPGFETVIQREPGHDQGEYVHRLTMEQEVQAGSYVLNDFDFTKPKTSLKAKSEKSSEHAQSKFELYDYPGEYEAQAEGTTYSRVRIEEVHAQHEILEGQSNVRGIATGCTFTLKEAQREDLNRKLLVVSTSYHLDAGEYGTGMMPNEPVTCSFLAIDATKNFRAARVTPKPLIQGPQTAVVVGPKGEEIYTDNEGYGRIKVQFHWDRYGKADENSSCWVRVSQAAWAGKKWGSMYIPRVGQEVIVEFLEGDPDLPIVTGRVYNADNMPPYGLPAEKTKTTLKSSSSKGGTGFNELRFEDKKGSEQVFIHAEKDYDLRVKNIQKEWIGKDKHLIVTGDQMESVKGDKHLTVTGDQNEKVNGSVSLNVSMDLQQKVGMHHAVDAGQEIHLKAGMNVVIEAGMSVTLKAGGGFIVVGPAGVTISGTPVLINSGGSAGSGSGCSPDAAKAPLEADKAEGGGVNTVSATPDTKKATTTDSVKVSPRAAVLIAAAKSGTPFCEKCAAAEAAAASAGTA